MFTQALVSSSPLSLADEIHSRAISISARYKKDESDLIQILVEVDQHRVFLKRGHTSLFQYVVGELGLSESVAYNLISVARKAREVPELKASLDRGEITLTNARRIAPLLSNRMDVAEKNEWIKKASDLSARQLEKEIVKVRPEEATREHARYVNPTRVELTLGLSEKEMLRVRRAQDILSKSKNRPVTLEEVLQEMTSLFLERKDPVQKAKRHQVRKGSAELVSRPVEKVPSKPVAESGLEPKTENVKLKKAREPIPANIEHAVNLRDGGRCVHVLSDGDRCRESRFTHFHHRILVSQGGLNTVENLVTLCSAHHRLWHIQIEKGESTQ